MHHFYTAKLVCVCVLKACGFRNNINLSGERHCTGFGGFSLPHRAPLSCIENLISWYFLHACLPTAVCLRWTCIRVDRPLSLWGLMCLHHPEMQLPYMHMYTYSMNKDTLFACGWCRKWKRAVYRCAIFLSMLFKCTKHILKALFGRD